MSYLITGNLGYVGPVLSEYLKKKYPEKKIIGYDLGLFANLVRGVNYNPDFRQSIADSWPASIDDSEARNDWNWKENYNINEMTKDMIIQLSKKYNLVL